jgi:hypothetical protein
MTPKKRVSSSHYTLAREPLGSSSIRQKGENSHLVSFVVRKPSSTVLLHVMGNIKPSSRRRVRYQFILFLLIVQSSMEMLPELRARVQSRILYFLIRARVLVVIFRTIRQLAESNLKLGTGRSSSHLSNLFFIAHPTVRHCMIGGAGSEMK